MISRKTSYPLCHSERSGTDVEKQAIKSIIAAESNPEGAPAGGISALVYGIIAEHLLPTNRVRQPHAATNSYLPKHKKLPPCPRHSPKANQIFASEKAGSWGKFSVSEGGLEGESPVFQEGALSLQGLPPISSKNFHCTTCKKGGLMV